MRKEDEKVIIYQTKDGKTSIDVRLEGETVWLTANQMAILFGRDEKTIRKHINNVFLEGELTKDNNTHFLRIDNVKQPVAFYTLDVIISVGYRVKSQRGTQFRIWANKILKDYLIKGFAVNDKITQRKYEELSQLIHILGRTINSKPELSNRENLDLINVVMMINVVVNLINKDNY
ncbi:MAG: virulence RhuM family protein [Bacteroidales bacterium]|nr:virulence RhuM family protein [Bacteroidales bacterium]